MLKVIGTIATVILLVAFVGIGWYVSQRAFSVDYATTPARDMFKSVLGVTPPKGIDKVVVAGHSVWQTNMVWMKISGKPKTLLALSQRMNPIPANKFQYSSPAAFSAVLATDAKTAGWDEVPNLKDPQYFLFQNTDDSHKWVGNFIVSPKTHTAYVSAQRD